MTPVASRRAFTAAILAAAAAAPAFAKSSGAARAYPGVQAVIDQYVKFGRLSGAVVAVQPRGEPPAFVSGGRVDPDPEAPTMDADSIVRIFSMSKPITGLAALQLIDDGRLGLDQPIADILPAFSAPRVLVDAATGETRPASGPIRVRHLLTHTAGLGYAINRGTPLAALYFKAGLNPGARVHADGEGAWPTSLQDFADKLATQPLASDPGAVWSYSVALDLLGAIIERVAGQPFEKVLSDRIFRPLGMNDTDFFVPPAKAARLTSVLGVSPKGVRVADPRAASPYLAPPPFPSGGGGLLSTARDYARLCAAFLGEGETGGVRIVSRRIARLGQSNLLPAGVFAEERGHAFGAGMRLVTPASAKPGEEPAGSFGWGGAAGTTFWVDPKAGVAVTFMAQFFPSSSYPTSSEVRQSFYADWRG